MLSTPLPALAGYGDLVGFAEGAAALAERLDAMIAGTFRPWSGRLAAAREQTYETRTGHMLQLIDRALKQRAGGDRADGEGSAQCAASIRTPSAALISGEGRSTEKC